jgi:DNA-binding transcriptional LysR family regulator
VDLAIVTTPMISEEDVVSTTLKTFCEVPVGGESFRELTLGEPISLSDFAEYPIVSLGSKTSTYDYYLRLFQTYGLDFDAEIEAATADQLLPLIKHNLGIGFVPEDFLTDNQTDCVYRIPLDIPSPTRKIVLVKKRMHALSRPAKELERMILAHKE